MIVTAARRDGLSAAVSARRPTPPMLATVGDGDRRRITHSGGLTHALSNESIGLKPRLEEVPMASFDAQAHKDARAIWWIFGLVGLLSIAAGVIVLVEPGISLVTLAVVT